LIKQKNSIDEERQAALSLVFEASQERLAGWYSCDLLVRDKSGKSSIRHFYDLQDEEGDILCELDGKLAALNGRLAEYGDRVYLYTMIVSPATAKTDYRIEGGLFLLEDLDFRYIGGHPLPDIDEDEQSQAAYWLGTPIEYQGMLLLPGAPSTIWAYDGIGIFPYVEDSKIGPDNPAQYLAEAEGELYVATSSLSSYPEALEICSLLGDEIRRGDFLLSPPIQKLPRHQGFEPLRIRGES